jgi:hypothetical protein
MSKRTAAGRAPRTPRPQLAAALIVRDEEDRIGDCIGSLRGVVDEIHVHDTGSTDATPHVAMLLGAQVSRGPWTNDFAAARNAALEGWSANWVLSVDADELVVADREALRQFLLTTDATVLTVEIENRDKDGGTLRHVAARVFRPDVAQWYGRLHEQIVARKGKMRRVEVPPEILHLVHTGYASTEILQAKSVRNAELARAEIGDLARLGDDVSPDLAARSMLDLGRSQLGAAQLQDAIDTFEAVRELFPDRPEAIRATDMLARLLINNGMPDVGLALVLQLRVAGASTMFCDWLEAHALVKLGHLEMARDLLAGVTEIVDVAGSVHDAADLDTLKQQVDDLLAARAVAAG